MTAKIYEFPKKKPKEPDDDSYELFRQEVIDYFVMQNVDETAVETAFAKFEPMVKQVFYFASSLHESLSEGDGDAYVQLCDFHTGMVLHTIALELQLPEAL